MRDVVYFSVWGFCFTQKPATKNTMRILLVLVLIFVPTRQDSPCLEGFFGENCKLKCSRNCRPLETYLCDKSTGKCSEGCKSRLYGSTCNLTCNCPGYCIQATGECMDDVTTTTTSTQGHEAVPDCSCVVEYVVMGVIMLCLIAAVAFLILRRKRYPAAARQEEEQPTDCEAEPMRKETAEYKTIEIEEITTGMSNVWQPLLTEGTDLPGSSKPPEMENNENAKAWENATPIQSLQQENEHLKKKLQGTEKHLQECEKMASSIQIQILKNLGLPVDSVYHPREVIHSHLLLQCPKLKYNNSLVNVKVTHIDSHGLMQNRPKDAPATESQEEFWNYHGTSSTCSITRTGFDLYWEVSLDFKLKKPLGLKEVLLDLGFCSKEYRDVSTFTPTRENCYSIKLVGGTKNKICVFDGLKEQDNVLSVENLKDVNQSISIGILVNNKLSKIRYFELAKLKLIKAFEIKSTNELWPMFGLGAQLSATGILKLISGFDIEMTSEKKSMINYAK